jgi:aminopeptidase N
MLPLPRSMIALAMIALALLSTPSTPLFAGEEHVCRYCADGWNHQAAKEAGGNSRGRKYAPSRLVDVLHLKIEVTPDFRKRTVAGTTSIEFKPIAMPLKQLRLNAVHLRIDGLHSTEEVSDYTVGTDDLTITFAAPIPPGKPCTVEIEHSAEPRQGLYFRTPELGYSAEDIHLFTQGEAELARYWFPCHDYPNERSSTEMICHVPQAMTVLSNGKLISESTDPQGLKVVRWLQEKPHVPYLITLVAGNFHKLEDLDRRVPLAFYVQPSASNCAANSFRDTADIMDFFEQEIGVPFPWNKYYQVTVSDFGFGGMENTSMTTLAHRTLFTEATENIRSGRSLDAHEMAHQWFGDYVTCKDWSHLWLNEGFATYYALLHAEHQFGRDDLLYGLYRDATQRVIPKHQDRRPIVYNQYLDPKEQFDFRSYPKGSWVLHMLRCQLGKSLYRDCIRTYLETNALTSVTTPDLVKVFERLSGRSLDQFFDQWVYHARHPSLKLTCRWLAKKKLAHVSIKQTQQTNDQVLQFEFPTVLRFHVENRVIDHAFEVTQSEHDFYVPLPAKPKIVRFDPDYTVLADVEFKKTDELLLAQIENQQDMIGRIFALRQLADRKTSAAIDAIGKVLLEDPFYGARIEAAKALGGIREEQAFKLLEQAIASTDARVRLAVVEAIGSGYSPKAGKLLQQIIQHEKNPAIVAAAIRALGKYGDPDSLRLVRTNLESQSFRNELAQAAIVAIERRMSAEPRAALMQTIQGRESEFTSIVLSAGLRCLAKICRPLGQQPGGQELGQESPAQEPLGKGTVEEFLRGYVQHPKQRVRVSAIQALGLLGDYRSTALLESLADEKSTDPMARAAVSALKELRKIAPYVPAELTELRKRVDQLRDDSQKLRKELDELKNQAKAETERSAEEEDEP